MLEPQQVQVVDGPVIPGLAGQPLYQVTLASGAIATRPTDFPDYEAEQTSKQVTVAQSGQILRLPAA